jgi:HicB family
MAIAAGKTRARESARESTHSGRLLLRMPRSLHAQLAARADEAGTSLNQYIVETLATALSGERSPTVAGDTSAAPPRSLRLALVVNAVVVALAAATCIALLVFAWR